ASRVRLVALRQGKSIRDAVFTVVDSDLTEETIKADAEGSAVWTPQSPGHYSVYTRQTLKEDGLLDGTRYVEIREFATLALTWPPENREGDAAAAALFHEAVAHRAQWRDFPGFSAELHGQLDGRPFTGKVTVQDDGSVEVVSDDPAGRPWLKDQIE